MYNPSIEKNFRKRFEKAFRKRNPDWKKDVEPIFRWLRFHGKNARRNMDCDTYEALAMETSTHFSQFGRLKDKVDFEYRKTIEEITKRSDNLRTVRKKKRGKFLAEAEIEEEKVPPEK